MRAGRLDRRVSLLRNNPTTDDFGQMSGSTKFATVWANVERKGGSEPSKSLSEYPVRRVVFTIRYRDDIGPDDLVSWDSNTYEIHTVEEISYTRKRFMRLITTLKGLQDG